MEHISIGQLCVLLGISLSTAYRWLKSGKIVEDFRTFGNHRRFNLHTIQSKFLETSKAKENKDLERQKEKLIHYCHENNYNKVEVIEDLGSGLNYKKSGLKKLINLILHKQINILVINHKDHLLRFGSELIFNLCKFNKIQVIVLEDQTIQKSFEQELTTDVIELMTVFCARLYGSRSHKNKIKFN